MSVAQPRSALAYRTNADLPELSAAAHVSWSSDVVTLQTVNGGPGPLTAELTRLALIGALEQWSAPTCSALALHVASTRGDTAVRGDNINSVQWVNEGWQGAADSPAHTDVQLAQNDAGVWEIVEADIYLNAKHATFTEPTVTIDYLRAVFAHEVGHVIGLLHPCELTATDGVAACSDPNAGQLMHPLYGPSRVELSTDEVAGLCFLYPRQLAEPEPDSEPQSGRTLSGFSCRSDADCLDGMRCASSVCAPPGRGELGDPCKHSGDCLSASCNQFCSEPCAADKDCQLGAICQATAGPLGACSSAELHGYGRSCDSADQCLSGYCVEGASTTPLCTRPCGQAQANCPRGWSCEDLGSGEGEVCAPPVTRIEGGGCGCRMHQPRRGVWDWFPLLGAVLLMSQRVWSRKAAR